MYRLIVVKTLFLQKFYINFFKMRILFLLPFIFIGLTAAAQTISKQSISAMGGRLEAENNSLVLRQNIGEAQIGHMQSMDKSLQIGNGYIPSLKLEILSIPGYDPGFKIIAYPNPTSSSVRLSHPVIKNFSYKFYDYLGRLVITGIVNINENINIALLASGTYIIEVSDVDEKKSSAIKLIKY